MTQTVCGPSRRVLVHLPDSQGREGAFRGEGGPRCNSFSSFLSSSRIMRGTPLKGSCAIWCSSGRSKLSKSATKREDFVRTAILSMDSGLLGAWGPFSGSTRSKATFLITWTPFPHCADTCNDGTKATASKNHCALTWTRQRQDTIFSSHTIPRYLSPAVKSASSTLHFTICVKSTNFVSSWSLRTCLFNILYDKMRRMSGITLLLTEVQWWSQRKKIWANICFAN